MQNQMLMLFLILLFGLFACSYLGGKCTQEGLENPSPALPPPVSTSVSAPTPSSTTYSPTLPPLTSTPSSVSNQEETYNHFNASQQPIGVPASQIPKGDEDLYILKSQVVPPVCPSCPACPQAPPCSEKAGKIPPCPACERCEEPSYDCKLVPNYNAFNSKKMPVPALSDFTGFGM
jgi:hypothetical protein